MFLPLALALTTAAIPEGARITLEHGDARAGTYVSKPWGFSTNTHWIEGPSGVVLVDTQFLPSAIEEAVEWIEETTGKKVVLAIVLHPNPDKFNGTGFLKRRGVRVVTSEQVKQLIPAVHEKRVKWFLERYKPDYPAELVVPESFGAATRTLSAGGVELTAHVLGKGCSDAHVVVQFEDHVFTGDLVASGAHRWFELGYVFEWLDRLDELAAMKPKHVHPGRGPSGGAELLVRERAYLRQVTALMLERATAPNAPADPDAAALRRDVEAAYPGYRFAAFLELGLPAVYRRLREASARAIVAPISPRELTAKLKASTARATMVNAWATWCAPCLEEMPDLLRIHRRYRDQGLDLVLVSGDAPDAKSAAEATLRQLGVDFPSYLKTGTDMELIDAVDKRWSGALPATIVYAKGGRKVHFTEGKIAPETLEAQVRGVLGLRP